jgi:hypothetical protein
MLSQGRTSVMVVFRNFMIISSPIHYDVSLRNLSLLVNRTSHSVMNCVDVGLCL